MLRAMQATTFVKTVGISSVYSAGIIIFMAGQERLASYYTDFLIHVTRIAMPYESSTNSMNYLNKHLGTVKRVIKDLFSDYLTEEEMRLVIDASSDLYLSEMEALERGIVTHAGFIYPQNYLLADLMPVQ
jgi:ATP-dependent protease ClpP protease subunit